MKKELILFAALCLGASHLAAQSTTWPISKVETKPAARWWWMGSAVDKGNLTYNLESYANAGIGMLEITPIYGVKDNEANEIPFLSEQWMSMLQHTQDEAKRLGMLIDMNTGTGWPFGGPEVTIDDAASRLLIREYHLKGGERLTEPIVTEDEKQASFAKLSRLMAFSDKEKCIDLTPRVENGQLNWKAPKGEWTLDRKSVV